MILKLVSAIAVAIISACIVSLFRHSSESRSSYENVISSARNNKQSAVKTIRTQYSSSVWCTYDKTSSKMCYFENLCYVPENRHFIFILTNESAVYGLNSKNDFKTIRLSSVDKHNGMVMKLEVILDYHMDLNDYKSAVFVNEPVVLITRFKPDNIMHVIHDDILPIFVTFNHLCSGDIVQCVREHRLMFFDDLDDNSHAEWYKILSSKKPYNLNRLKVLTCFDKILVGLSRESVWFQYGFGEPQGPVMSATIDSILVNKFKNFILNSFSINEILSDIPLTDAVLLSRKSNRKIVNENFVAMKYYEIFRTMYPDMNKKIKVHILDPSQNTSIEIISIIVKSQILVGMHGSAMIYSLFLPKGAAIVELFPYGIQPQHVSPTRALCQLPGIFYNYLSWRNFKERNSIVYPERPALLGGIQHLSSKEQDRIRELKEIPAVECCHDPAYLYRMFQDTVIDENFEIILQQVLTNQKEMINSNPENIVNEYLKQTWFAPGPVSRLICSIDKMAGTVFTHWYEPYNIQTSNSKISVSFFVTVKVLLRVVTLETFSLSATVRLTADEKRHTMKDTDIQVWVRAMTDNIEGVESHSYCQLKS